MNEPTKLVNVMRYRYEINVNICIYTQQINLKLTYRQLNGDYFTFVNEIRRLYT